jgi:hypothetical protein
VNSTCKLCCRGHKPENAERGAGGHHTKRFGSCGGKPSDGAGVAASVDWRWTGTPVQGPAAQGRPDGAGCAKFETIAGNHVAKLMSNAKYQEGEQSL